MLGTTSRPIIFILNSIGQALPETVTLFLSSVNRTALNNGFPTKIADSPPYVTFKYAPYTYPQLLADSENQSFRIWRMRIDQILPVIPPNLVYPPPPPPDSTTQMGQTLNVITRESDGSLTSYPLTPYTDLDQTVWSAIEFRYPVIIDSDHGISFKMFSRHIVQISIWTDKNTSGTNKLLTGDSEKVFVKPMTIEEKVPYVVRLSPNNVGQIIYGQDSGMSFRPKKDFNPNEK